jgi:beta-lactamase regulating signal transducer with metallopeptidase domain
MWVWLDRFGRLLIDSTLILTILLSFVVLLMIFCQQPARRIVVAKAGILLAIFIIPLVASSPLPRVNPFLVLAIRSTIAQKPEKLFSANSADETDRRAVLSRQETGSSSGRERWWRGPWPLRLISLAYLIGVVIGLAWVALGFWGMHRLVRDSHEAVPAILQFYSQLLCAAEARQPGPELRVSARVSRPILASLQRSFILIPEELEDPAFDRESLRLIFFHELAHADQADSQFGAAASLAQSLWFFLPYLWWLRAQLRIDQEFLADQKTVQLTGSSAVYATRLVTMASSTEGSPTLKPIADSVPLLSGWWWDGGFKTPLLQRVVMLLHAPFPCETRAPRWWSLSIPTAILVLAILTSQLSLFAGSDETLFLAKPNASEGTPKVFQVAQFVAAPQVLNSTARSVTYHLPFALPSRYELSVEIKGLRSNIEKMHLAGFPLSGPAGPKERSDVPDDPSAWHRVALNRSENEVTLQIDGQSIPIPSGVDRASDSLTIEPSPDQPAVMRNLTVIW